MHLVRLVRITMQKIVEILAVAMMHQDHHRRGHGVVIIRVAVELSAIVCGLMMIGEH